MVTNEQEQQLQIFIQTQPPAREREHLHYQELLPLPNNCDDKNISTSLSLEEFLGVLGTFLDGLEHGFSSLLFLNHFQQKEAHSQRKNSKDSNQSNGPWF